MPIPPMKPSANPNYKKIMIEGGLSTTLTEMLLNALDASFNDGYAANDRAERMLAALREPSADVVTAVAIATVFGGAKVEDAKAIWDHVSDKRKSHDLMRARDAIAAIHDLLASIAETQAQERIYG